jgi:RimJ/RimL family protein N-acetyltransferase
MLNGNLVRLRAVEITDLDRCYAWINDREVTQFMVLGAASPISRAQEEEWVRKATLQTAPPVITLAIETLTEDRHIGNVGLHDFEQSNRNACLGIMIGDKSCWSHGYGTDAIVTLLDFAFDELNLHRVWLEVNDDNARAIACYRKCGFVEEGRLREDRYHDGTYGATLVMGVLAEEFRALHRESQ